MNFQMHLDPDTPPTADESRRMKEAIQVCGSPKRAVLALLRLTHSLALDLTNTQAMLGEVPRGDVHYASPGKDVERGHHMYADDPEPANANGFTR